LPQQGEQEQGIENKEVDNIEIKRKEGLREGSFW
jgi:hypothetical protein